MFTAAWPLTMTVAPLSSSTPLDSTVSCPFALSAIVPWASTVIDGALIVTLWFDSTVIACLAVRPHLPSKAPV